MGRYTEAAALPLVCRRGRFGAIAAAEAENLQGKGESLRNESSSALAVLHAFNVSLGNGAQGPIKSSQTE